MSWATSRSRWPGSSLRSAEQEPEPSGRCGADLFRACSRSSRSPPSCRRLRGGEEVAWGTPREEPRPKTSPGSPQPQFFGGQLTGSRKATGRGCRWGRPRARCSCPPGPSAAASPGAPAGTRKNEPKTNILHPNWRWGHRGARPHLVPVLGALARCHLLLHPDQVGLQVAAELLAVGGLVAKGPAVAHHRVHPVHVDELRGTALAAGRGRGGPARRPPPCHHCRPPGTCSVTAASASPAA